MLGPFNSSLRDASASTPPLRRSFAFPLLPGHGSMLIFPFIFLMESITALDDYPEVAENRSQRRIYMNHLFLFRPVISWWIASGLLWAHRWPSSTQLGDMPTRCESVENSQQFISRPIDGVFNVRFAAVALRDVLWIIGVEFQFSRSCRMFFDEIFHHNINKI